MQSVAKNQLVNFIKNENPLSLGFEKRVLAEIRADGYVSDVERAVVADLVDDGDFEGMRVDFARWSWNRYLVPNLMEAVGFNPFPDRTTHPDTNAGRDELAAAIRMAITDNTYLDAVEGKAAYTLAMRDGYISEGERAVIADLVDDGEFEGQRAGQRGWNRLMVQSLLEAAGLPGMLSETRVPVPDSER
jgi:hypothetical protein